MTDENNVIRIAETKTAASRRTEDDWYRLGVGTECLDCVSGFVVEQIDGVWLPVLVHDPYCGAVLRATGAWPVMTDWYMAALAATEAERRAKAAERAAAFTCPHWETP